MGAWLANNIPHFAATARIFLVFISCKVLPQLPSDPSLIQSQSLPKCPGFLSWLSTHLHLKRPHPLCQHCHFHDGQHHPRWGRRQSIMEQKETTRTSVGVCFPYMNRKPGFNLFWYANGSCTLSGSHGRMQRAEAGGGAFIHGLVFCVLWHCRSHAPNLVDLWIVLSGFNYTNPWKIARWLKKNLKSIMGQNEH